MSIATLINLADPSFPFEHDQIHRDMIAAEANPSTLTPILDPSSDPTVPAGDWQTAHAQAHQDFADSFSAITWPSTALIADLTLTEGATEFWVFTNKTLHDLANTVLVPSA